MKKFLVFLICGIVSGAAFAQENSSKDRWYVQAEVGVNNTGTETMGIGTFKHNLGFMGNIEGGYEFNPYIGLGLQLAYDRNNYKPADYLGFNTLQPSLNLEWNITQTLLGYKENRKNAVRLYAGIAAAWTSTQTGGYHVDEQTDNGNALGFRAGLQYERNLGKAWGLVVDAGINTLNDKFDQMRDANKNMDSHLDVAIGVRKYFGFGNSRKRRSDFKETIVNVIEKRDTTVLKEVVEKRHPRDVYSIFFDIDKIDIRPQEVAKIQAVADFMKANPEKVVFVFGYADKNTGTYQRNQWLAKNRARVIIEQLTDTYGIDPSRILSYDQEGDNVQPFTEEEFEKNRATICVITDLVR